MPLIRLNDVSRDFTVRKKASRWRRTYTVVHAVRELNFDIGAGEFVGYLGGNGAGKSTTIKMLTGILSPTRGRVELDGRDPFRDRSVAYQVGAMFGQRNQLWWDLPLSDSFEQLRYIYRTELRDYRERLEELVDILDLGSLLSTPVRQLSLGQRIRGELAASMIHGPKLLFLDEPTIGLDVVAKQKIRDFLTVMNRDRGVTILLTTHDLDDLEHMCSRLILLSAGQVVGDGPIQDLFDAHRLERTMVVDLTEVRDPLDVPGARLVSVDGPRQTLKFRTQDVSAAQVIAAVSGQAVVKDLTLREPDVADLVHVLNRKGDAVRTTRGVDR
ncbi:ATP-binding cassette domain-containing protein [Streptomyces sp. NPDC020192]|uniref:ATP-binding cassette domain-containing protein n=1 Tax=Streptomyces sp. NPDC020192 TaxID=3365066 RepID=UPI00379F7041